IPSVNSSSIPKVLDSSTVITPSLPTLSTASAIFSPISGSAALIAPTLAISSFESTSFATVLIRSTASSTARSIPRLSDIGFAPAATLRRPSFTIAWASTVAVVVPSPATSSVFLATSLTSSAPIFSYGSSRSISLAMLTPSLVMVGAPHFFSSTTLRPLGPRVTLTASARMFIPRSRPRRASSSKAMILAIRVVPPTRNGWVTAGRPRRTDRVPQLTSRALSGPRQTVEFCHSRDESANPMISTRPPRVQMAAATRRWHGEARTAGMPCGPRGSRWLGSELDAQAPGGAGALARGAQPAQALDEHRVGLERGRAVDEGVEHLVVAGGAHVEQLADRLLLGAGVLPPLPLERDDLAVAVGQLACLGGAHLCCGVHGSSVSVRAQPW